MRAVLYRTVISAESLGLLTSTRGLGEGGGHGAGARWALRQLVLTAWRSQVRVHLIRSSKAQPYFRFLMLPVALRLALLSFRIL